MVINIEKAEYIKDYIVKLYFSDKTSKVVDFESFLSNSHNPMTRKYLDKKKFKSFKVKNGDIIWNDYELCFPVWDLYRGQI